MMNLQSKLLNAPFMKAALADLYPAPASEAAEQAQGIFAMAMPK